jgi:hypothetical protein
VTGLSLTHEFSYLLLIILLLLSAVMVFLACGDGGGSSGPIGQVDQIFRGSTMNFSIDASNIFNEGCVLSRNTNLNSGSADWVNATLSPRIFRLGVRVNWR